MSLLTKLIDGKKITDSDLAEALYEVCDDVHASCNELCPVYDEGYIPDFNNGCPYFKNGKAMLRIIRQSRLEHPEVKK